MKDAIDDILHTLTERGYRITASRKEVLHIMFASDHPLSIQEIVKRCATSDEVSVYRTVRMLTLEKLAEEILVPSQAPQYALSRGHHHHAVCTSCGFMEHLECDFADVAKPSTFKTIASHELTLYGVCKKCA